ncbi:MULTISPECIES: hypothetical protein [Escherichia]|uniref:hypothetical protein n=1 Tax=Escherichia TaxID=561 RepID=UPI000CF76FD7|nr:MULTISPECIES: hypothetical protein [Escherichia]EFB2839708.1 hypothetical protein [Escherichia coli]EFJ2713486.1 hypothetical protein [Escherichia coli]EHS3896975.1 hypothetical protein [Escherichia coli]EHS4058893.1 hypothetical protein [Escherichia coli]EHW6096075.1 hypothetical protein [Escherichia coli]
MRLAEFMQSDIYVDFLNDLDKSLSEKIDRKSKVYDVVVNLMEKWLEYASMSFDDLHWVISNCRSDSISYIVKKQVTYTEANGGKDNIINQAPKINFPIGHLIEYYLLSKRPNDLLDYVTKIRIPGSKKYVKEIGKIFSEIKYS